MRTGASQAPDEAAAPPLTPSAKPALTALALQVGSMAAANMHLPSALSGVCRSLPRAVDAAGVALVVTAFDGIDVLASDPQAGWLGEVQRRAGAGPLSYALRSGRPMATPDLTRVGPPDLAAAAAECGITTSVVIPLTAGEGGLGALQLLGDAGHPVGDAHVELLRPLVAALTARLVDVLVLEGLRQSVGRLPTVPEQPAPTAASPAPELPSGDATSPMAAPPGGDAVVAERAEPEVSSPDPVSAVDWFGPVEPQPAASVHGPAS